MLKTVRLDVHGDRKPVQLSGGQRQRVALARALVNRPRVLLLDEPLGALDLKLRQEMQLFLKQLQRELGMTFIYVTHDQEEALTMSDQIAVFNHGRIEQLGGPAEVYDRPATEFVAGFVGTSNIVERGGRRYCVRPERITLVPADGPASPRPLPTSYSSARSCATSSRPTRASSSRSSSRPTARRSPAAGRFGSPGATRMLSSYRQENRKTMTDRRSR